MRHRTAKLDRIAVRLSGLCLLHCLALPLLIAVFPVAGLAERWHESFHQIMLFLVVPLAVLALGRGFVRHRRGEIVVVGAVGVALLAFAAIVLHGQAHHAHAAEAGERWMTVAGALLLAAAHWRNARAVTGLTPCHVGHAPAEPSGDVRQTPPIARQ